LTYLLTLTTLFSIEWIILAIAPYDRKVWACENILVLLAVIVLALTYKSFPFSRVSYACIFLFLCLHEVGAHYTYGLVPYDAWGEALFGFSINSLLGLQRNHYDRIIHFSYGLLIAYPMREVFIRIVNVRGFWGYFFPLDITMSSSMIFELFEWLIAVTFADDVGIAYLGAQGDIWDAQKDMISASLGATLSISMAALIDFCLKHDFLREWRESLRIKHQAPLGENEIIRLWHRLKFLKKKDKGN
jgi:putative membrane protein